jgi:hypothetical protein
VKPRVTICLRPDGTFEMLVNEAGRDQLVKELQGLSERWDHFHMDHYDEPEMADHTEVHLADRPYHEGDQLLLNAKVLFRPDHWDRQYYPHVMEPDASDAD